MHLGFLALIPLNLLLFDNLPPKLSILIIYPLNLLNYSNVHLLINFILNKKFDIGRSAIGFILDLEIFYWKWIFLSSHEVYVGF